MATAKSAKAADPAQICRELLAALDKFYGKSQSELPSAVLDAMLFSVCLEDTSWDAAKAAYDLLLASYFDLNEIRVSSTAELAKTLSTVENADWKGLRIRALLRHVFESSYSFDFEKLRRQTPELTLKTLKKITELTPFIREFALQEILGSHTVALDNSMLLAAHWLGLLPASMQLPEAMEFLKGVVRKSDASNFCRQLRKLATDARFSPRFSELPPADLSAAEVMSRFEDVTTGKSKKPIRKPDSPAAATAPPPAPVPPSKPQKPSAAASASHDPKAPKKNSAPAKPSPPAPPARTPSAKTSAPAAPAAPKSQSGAKAPQKDQPAPKTKSASAPAAPRSNGGTAKPAAKAAPAPSAPPKKKK